MSDFHQRGLISTLPRLAARSLCDIERKLEDLARGNPVALVLPSTLADLRQPALRQILREVRGANYLAKIVVSLNQANEGDLAEAKELVGNDRRTVLLWSDHSTLRELAPGSLGGKGFNFWIALGFLLETGDCKVVVTHDTDILNYSRELAALLTLPLIDPELGYSFVKGYYPRISGESGGPLFGRVTRLFVGPLLRALVRVEGHSPLVDFIDGFRYPLSGEFGGRLEDLAQYAMPESWGLEMDLLCSIHRSIAPERVAQIDLGANYLHKHQRLDADDPSHGLTRLAAEIAGCLLQQLAWEGVQITDAFLQALRATYLKAAADTIRRYRHVAVFNQLKFNEEDEVGLVESFAQTLLTPTATFSLPSWAAIRRKCPDLSEIFSRVKVC